MSRAGKPTDNPANEALNGWIKKNSSSTSDWRSAARGTLWKMSCAAMLTSIIGSAPALPLDTIRRIITASAFTVVSWNKGIPSPSAYWAKNLSSCRNEGLQKNDFASCLPFVSPSGTARPDTTCKYRLFKAWEHCVYFQKRNLAKNIASVYFWKSNLSKNNFHVHFWKTKQKINIFCVHFSWQVQAERFFAAKI